MPPEDLSTDDICYTPATKLAEAVRTKALSPVEITQAVLDRMEAINPKLNAFCTPTPELALREAKAVEQAVMKGEPLGPLAGVPYSVKDLVITKGIKTMRGSRIYENDVPTEDTPSVERLREAGGIMLGKTCTPEFGWKGLTDSPLTGITRNPWNLDTTPGGSSGGAAAQVASGMGPLAVGTDGGGSIRIPCCFTGIYGIKPSYGRVPTYPASNHDSLSHTGPMTRTVADAALMLGVMAGPHPADRFSLETPPADYTGRLNEGIKGLRVAWSLDLGFAIVDPEVAEMTAKAAKSFADLGCEVEEATPEIGDITGMFLTVYLMGIAGGLAPYVDEWRDRMDPELVPFIDEGMKITGVELVQAQIERHRFWDRMRRFFERYDLLLTPGLSTPAFPVSRLAPEGGLFKNWWDWTPFTYPFNFTGNPAASVPVGFSKGGLPIGLQIVGNRFADLTVLQASAAYEAAHPWAHKRPAL